MAADARELKARTTLAPGVNLVAIRLSNSWGGEATRQLALRFVRPPVILTFEPPAMSDRAVLDLTAEVQSPADLPPTSARVNDKLFRDDRLRAELLDREKGLWRVTLRDVELREGENTLTLTVANRDGE